MVGTEWEDLGRDDTSCTEIFVAVLGLGGTGRNNIRQSIRGLQEKRTDY